MKDGINIIIKRDENINDEEAILMEPMTAVALYRLREVFWKKNMGFSLGKLTEYLNTDRELQLIKQEELGYTVIHT